MLDNMQMRRALAALLLLSCTYSFTGFFPKELRFVHVEAFENSTTRAGLEEEARRAFEAAIREDGRLVLVGEPEAKLLIRGSISSLRKDAYEHDASGAVLSYKITVSGSVEFYMPDSDRAYLGPNRYSGWSIYRPGSGTEEEAIEEALGDMAKRALADLMSSGF